MSLPAVKAFLRYFSEHGLSLHAQDEDALQKALNAAFETMYGVRTPTAAYVTPTNERVICDDGTTWIRGPGEQWTQAASIPGTVSTGGGAADPTREHNQLDHIRSVIAGYGSWGTSPADAILVNIRSILGLTAGQ